MSLFIKQRENINTSKEMPQKYPQHKDIALGQTKRKNKPNEPKQKSERILLYFLIQVKNIHENI